MRIFGYLVLVTALVAVTYMAFNMRSGDVDAIEPAAGNAATYTGSLIYLDRMALSPEATINVQIADENGAVISETSEATQGRQVPVPFSISVDTQTFEPNKNYVLIASLQDAATTRTADALPLVYLSAGTHALGELIARMNSPQIGAPETTTDAQFERPQNIEYVGTQWRLINMNGQEPVADSNVYITFGDDGRIFGNSGCNNIGGAYEMNENVLVINPNMISTMMACQNEDVNAQERAFTSQLIQSSSIARDGDTLILTANDGGTLTFINN